MGAPGQRKKKVNDLFQVFPSILIKAMILAFKEPGKEKYGSGHWVVGPLERLVGQTMIQLISMEPTPNYIILDRSCAGLNNGTFCADHSMNLAASLGPKTVNVNGSRVGVQTSVEHHQHTGADLSGHRPWADYSAASAASAGASAGASVKDAASSNRTGRFPFSSWLKKVAIAYHGQYMRRTELRHSEVGIGHTGSEVCCVGEQSAKSSHE